MKKIKVFGVLLTILLTGCTTDITSSVPISSGDESENSFISEPSTSIESSLIESSEFPVTSAPSSSAPTSSEPINDYNGYYKDLDFSLRGTALLNALRTIVNSGYIGNNYSTAWTVLEKADEDIENSNNIIQVYSRYTRPKSERDTGGPNDTWNREHVVPQSAMGCSKDNIGPCTDEHNLFASDKGLNGKRGNNKLGWVTSGSTLTDSKGRATTSRSSGGLFDPGNEARGEVARATLYMIVKWDFNVNINGNLTTMLEWNNMYQPTAAREIKRNNAVYETQRNRNPFIDYPWLADAIWG